MEKPKIVAPYDDSQWKANVQAFRDYLAAYHSKSLKTQEVNRKEAERLAQEHRERLERRRKENPYLFGYVPNKSPLPMLTSGAIVERPRRLNIEVLEKETGVSKRKKQSVFSSEPSPQTSSAA